MCTFSESLELIDSVLKQEMTAQLSHKCLYGIKMNCSVGYYRDPDEVLFQNVNKTYKKYKYGNFFGYIICHIMYVNI